MYEKNPHNIQSNIKIYTHFEDIFKKMTDKADRIYHAVFLLTKYVSHKNMTDRLQYLGIDFLEMSYMLHPRENEHHAHVASEISYVLKELKTLTQGVVIQGILSPESKNLFDREVDMFIKTLVEYVDGYKEYYSKEHGVVSPLFDENFFGEDLDFLPLMNYGNGISNLSDKKNIQNSIGQKMQKLNDKNQKIVTDKKEKPPVSIGQKMPLNRISSIGHSAKNILLESKNSQDKNHRKKTILKFIKDNTQAQVQSSLKDILNHIGNCSEKTIQRELNDLIKDGYLRKEGDRRWSRYFFLKDME